MQEQDKILSREQLIGEMVKICQRVAELEASGTAHDRDRELELLNRAGQEFATTLDMQQITDQLLPTATDIIGAEGASVWLWEDPSQGWLVCRTAYHHQSQKRLPVNLRLRAGDGIAGWVAQARKTAVVHDVRSDPRFFPGIDEQTGFNTKSVLAVPLWARDRVIGVLEVVNKQAGDFDDSDRLLVGTLATSAATAIENARMTEALRQRTLDLQANSRQLDGLTRTLADDLRGPLGLIVSFAQMLEEDVGTLSSEELQQYLHTIVVRGRQMVDVIDELLTTGAEFSREKRVEDQIGPLDMTAVVTEALERVAFMVDQDGGEVILPESWPVALGYGPWVEEVWTNYLGNGIKHGGRPPRVELGADRAPGMVRFWVRDNGPGLTPGEQVRLFTPPGRHDLAPNVRYGFELALVQRIVEKLGGEVGVESEVGQGSLFFFTLPAAE